MAKKKEEAPVKPAPATALIFQAPDLPTPKVDARSGKLKVDVDEAPKPERAPRERKAPAKTASKPKAAASEKRNLALPEWTPSAPGVETPETPPEGAHQ